MHLTRANKIFKGLNLQFHVKVYTSHVIDGVYIIFYYYTGEVWST